MGTTTIRTAIVDDHPMVRYGLKDMLIGVPGVDVVAEAGGGLEAIQVLLRAKPDLVLLDMVLPELDGMKVLKEIRRRIRNVRVIIVSHLESDTTVREAFANQADGYIPKCVTQDELAQAIETVLRGDIYLHPSIGPHRRAGGDLYVPPLTQRQREVLTRMAKGASNREIADELEITPETVKSHVGEILRRLGCKDRTSAVARALNDHLI